MNPSSPAVNKPMHNGKNSKTKAAPAPNKAASSVPRQKVTGKQPAPHGAMLPMNRAAMVLKAAASKRRSAEPEGDEGCY